MPKFEIAELFIDLFTCKYKTWFIRNMKLDKLWFDVKAYITTYGKYLLVKFEKEFANESKLHIFDIK